MTDMTCAPVEVLAVADPDPGFRRLLLAGAAIDEACPLLRPGPDIVEIQQALDGAGTGVRPVADAFVKLLVPAPGCEVIEIDVDSPLREQLHRLEVEKAGWMRTYTARAVARVRTEHGDVPAMVVDVALHGDPEDAEDPHQGPGLRWARAARPGDRLSMLLPGPDVPAWSAWAPQGATGILAIGDETAAPALVSIALELAADPTPHRPMCSSSCLPASASLTRWMLRCAPMRVVCGCGWATAARVSAPVTGRCAPPSICCA